MSTQRIYSKGLIQRRVALHITEIGSTLEQSLAAAVEKNAGKCAAEGYIRTTKMVTHSVGTVAGDKVCYDVAAECQICLPVAGQLIQCRAIGVNKAGIRAEHASEVPSPIDVFVARDINYNSGAFSRVQEGDVFTCRVVGQRFELNDPRISVIAEIV